MVHELPSVTVKSSKPMSPRNPVPITPVTTTCRVGVKHYITLTLTLTLSLTLTAGSDNIYLWVFGTPLYIVVVAEKGCQLH